MEPVDTSQQLWLLESVSKLIFSFYHKNPVISLSSLKPKIKNI